MTKTILMSLSKRNIDLFDHVDEIQEALNNANRNLYGRFGIWLSYLKTYHEGFLIKMDHPDDVKITNVGIRLKGVATYLKRHYPFYEHCVEGTRLFRYYVLSEEKEQK